MGHVLTLRSHLDISVPHFLPNSSGNSVDSEIQRRALLRYQSEKSSLYLFCYVRNTKYS